MSLQQQQQRGQQLKVNPLCRSMGLMKFYVVVTWITLSASIVMCG